MSQKAAVPESVLCAYEAARFVSNVLRHEEILAWTATWRADKEPSKWPASRQVHIRATMRFNREPHGFTCQVTQEQEFWAWKATSVLVKDDEGEVEFFDFRPDQEGLRLEERVERLRQTALSAVCSCLAGAHADYVGEVISRMSEKFDLHQEPTGAWVARFQSSKRINGWEAVVTLRANGRHSVSLTDGGPITGETAFFELEDGVWLRKGYGLSV